MSKRSLPPFLKKFIVFVWGSIRNVLAGLPYRFFSIYTIILGAILLPLHIQRWFHIDPTGTPLYETLLTISNPIMSAFNNWAYVLTFGALAAAFYFAYHSLPNQKPVRRINTAMAWASLTVSFGLIGILGNSISTLNMLSPTEPFGLIGASLSFTAFGMGIHTSYWLRKEAARPG